MTWIMVPRGCTTQNTKVISMNNVKPDKVAIIGASGRYGRGILARAEQLGPDKTVVTVAVGTRS